MYEVFNVKNMHLNSVVERAGLLASISGAPNENPYQPANPALIMNNTYE